jgi:cell division septum initiation protein DivIVA
LARLRSEVARLTTENGRLRDRIDQLHRQYQVGRIIAALPRPDGIAASQDDK